MSYRQLADNKDWVAKKLYTQIEEMNEGDDVETCIAIVMAKEALRKRREATSMRLGGVREYLSGPVPVNTSVWW